MATVTTNISRQFKDLDLNFTIHPLKKDLNKHLDATAVINAIKNLVLTSHYEKPFNPDYGSNVRKLLFETLDIITASAIEREIKQTIESFEPRVRIIGLTVIPDVENNGFSVRMEFSIVNQTNPVSISFLLERIR
jgi:phage baseplate assembly protein W